MLFIRNNKAFTLIEILIALTIIAFFTSMALPTISSFFGENLRSSARKLAGTVKYLYSQSILRNRIMRLVVDLDENIFWLEMAPEDYKLIEEEDGFSLEDEDEQKEKFSKFDSKVLKKSTPSKGVEFISVYSASQGEVEEGKAYIHFFPNGVGEYGIVRMSQKNSERVYSIEIEPMLGMAKVWDEDLEPRYENE